MKIRREPTEQEIAQRAYELYQQRGAPGGEDVSAYWQEARAELEAAEAQAESIDAGLVEGGEPLDRSGKKASA